MPTLFTWNAAFVTSLPAVDAQHQHLVGLINEFGELVMSAERVDVQAFDRVSGALLDYARFHFDSEESQMRAVGLDLRYIERHCAEHRAFLVEAMHLRGLGHSPTPERAGDLLEYLVHWLAYHILGVDQSMARQVRAVQEMQSPGQAYEAELRFNRTNTEPLLAALGGLFQTVSKRNSELHALNCALEERVRQRTRELEEANLRLQQQSTHDDLTGLPNRRFAMLTLQQLWDERQRYGGSLAVLMLDADHFKGVNDRFGHAEGDAVLRALATRLRETVRGSDSVFRLGGDEFLVACPHTDRTGAEAVADKILAARRPHCDVHGVECWDGAVSIGIAEALAGMARPDELLRAADVALYAAKRRGGARLVSDGAF